MTPEGLRQPDARSCGATVLVVARMLADPAYDKHVRPDFAAEVLATHRRITGVRGPAGRPQLPWPRALGTPPWALARALGTVATQARPARPYRTRPVRTGRRGRAFDEVLAALWDGRPVALYVGTRLLPRHVVLVLGEPGHGAGLRCYEPAQGRLVDVGRQSFVEGRLGLAGWDRAWFVVLPAAGGVRMRARRTRA